MRKQEVNVARTDSSMFPINGSIRDMGSKRYDITANVYVDRQIQQFQKNFKCRRGKGHLEEGYPVFFEAKVASLGCNGVYHVTSSSALHVSSIYTRVCLTANITGPLLSARSSRVSGL